MHIVHVDDAINWCIRFISCGECTAINSTQWLAIWDNCGVFVRQIYPSLESVPIGEL